ncbi:alanine racemase [Aquincola sp. S2]|uniref:Alanine racemase n=1 Tax=Pseudaquabacterium terrae TaxID=2732868 RepID=A0ABX2ECI2_9BURK|nr:alanine racemase [Aquabacterium terrae]NRF65507.1 alanine racemase [Aquabacterium terrae]
MAIQRRTWLIGGAAAALVAAGLARPGDRGGAHDSYFQRLATALAGLPAQPTLVIDRTRLRANLAAIRQRAQHPLRVVVKSLPSLALIDAALAEWKSDRAMLFNAPQLALIAAQRPAVQLLLGKPLPASAAAWALDALRGDSAAPRRIEWLVDSAQRLAEYRALAQQRGLPLRINIEIDVGLHRGGVEDEAGFAALLDVLKSEPLLQFSGLMGYDAHLAAIPDLPGARSGAQAESQRRYAALLALARQRLGEPAAPWTLNAAGSPTFQLHDPTSSANELSVGSAAVKPSDFDKPSLAALQPAAFIATPVLKDLGDFRLPRGVEWIAGAARAWDINQRRAFAMHGGHWLADPVSPPGVAPSGLYGPSSNQQVLVASPSAALQPGDWLFLRPRQSEAVLLQFGALAVVDEGQVVERWPVFDASA